MTFDSAAFLKTLPQKPGVYQMLAEGGEVLYVGKAKNLKSRVSSYFRGTAQNTKTMALVARINDVTITVTRTESEALLLENNLIKSLRPQYNIMLKDDKSYPYIFVSNDAWPRIELHRGAQREKGRYFGPYPSGQAAREALSMLQKVFRVRQCSNSFFSNRSRPCLQYQIKRCTGPCVNLVETERYQRDVQHSIDFLTGSGESLSSSLIEEMNQASQALAFEQAALLRDQIAMIRAIQRDQVIERGVGNLDVLAADIDGDEACIHILYVRQGRMIGSRSFFPKYAIAESWQDALSEFIPRHYLAGPAAMIPAELLVPGSLPDDSVLVQGLSEYAGRKIELRQPRRGRGAEWINLAIQASAQNLRGRQAGKQSYLRRLSDLTEAFGLPQSPLRMECYDISHTQGEQTVGSCVVFDKDGPNKQQYRRFNIEGITGGDDYAAMQQVLMRRFSRLKKGEGAMPDIAIVDGGKGQLSSAQAVFDELGINNVLLMGVAKGATRKSGWERFYVGDDATEIVIDASRPAFHLIQHIRDEAHRFAITGHKARRGKKLTKSTLEDIAGIGPKRRKQLLDHFGGLSGVASASVVDLQKVPSVNRSLAESIYARFNGGD